MKQKFLLYCLLALLGNLNALYAAEYDQTYKFWYYVVGNEAIITGKTHDSNTNRDAYTDKKVTIPSKVKYNGKDIPITRVGEYAFFYCSNVESVTFEGDLKSIGAHAFANCSNLTEVTFPNNQLISIRTYAFGDCKKLKKIGDLSKVTELEIAAFQHCKSLENVNLSGMLKRISPAVFNGCSSLKSVGNLSNVTSIERLAFYECSSLESVGNLNNVTSIGNDAFCGCKSLESVGNLSNVTSIGNDAFGGCESLKSVGNLSNVTSIGESAFNGCKALESVGDLSNVISIGNNAFENCLKLHSVDIRNVTSIGASAFRNCTNLEEVIIPKILEKIEKYTFEGCTNLKKVVAKEGNVMMYPEILEIGLQAFLNCSSLQYSPDLTNTTKIGNQAFSGCSNMCGYRDTQTDNGPVKGTIQFEQLSELGEFAFQGCNKILEIIFSDDKKTFKLSTITNASFQNCTNLQRISICSKIKHIGNAAFQGCSRLSSVFIPQTVELVGDAAFQNSGLIEVTGGEGLSYIGNNVFQGNTLLETIKIGKDPEGSEGKGSYIGTNIEYIMKEAFKGCRKLVSIRLGVSTSRQGEVRINNGLVPYIGDNAFDGCTSLQKVTFYSGLKGIYNAAFQSCTSLDNIYLPISLKELGDNAFKGDSNLKNGGVFELDNKGEPKTTFQDPKPGHLRVLGSQCFANTGIVNIDKTWTTAGSRRKRTADSGSLDGFFLPDGIEEIGEGAFSDCKDLVSIDLPSTVKKIDGDAFKNTAWYDNQPDGLLYLGKTAYKYKGNMSRKMSLAIKDGTEYVAAGAFKNCWNLIGVSIPASMKTIGNSAFASCNLSSVNLPNGLESIGEYAFNYNRELTTVIIPESIHRIEQYTFQYCI